jgi:hypothetical protein
MFFDGLEKSYPKGFQDFDEAGQVSIFVLFLHPSSMFFVAALYGPTTHYLQPYALSPILLASSSVVV